MTGSTIEALADFINNTGPAILKGPEVVVNEVQRRTFLQSLMLQGKDILETLQGGNQIQDTIYLDLKSQYEHYGPNPEFTYKLDEVSTTWAVQWAFTVAKMAITEHEIGLNSGDLKAGALHHQFKRIKRIKEQNLLTDWCNGNEDDLLATPNNATMEASGADPRVPYSLAVGLNEFTNGVPPGFTTVQGINPVLKPRWRPEQRTYAQHPGEVAVGEKPNRWDLFSELSKAFKRTKFMPMPKAQRYSDPVSEPTAIISSLTGCSNYEDGLRNAQDTFVSKGRQDPDFGDANFRGIPVVYIETMDFAEIFDDGASGFAAEFDASTDPDGGALGNPLFEGPRYMGLNGRYLNKVYHRDRMMKRIGPITPSRQPFTRIWLIDSWHNNIYRSRQRHFMISPSDNIAIG